MQILQLTSAIIVKVFVIFKITVMYVADFFLVHYPIAIYYFGCRR